MIFEAFMSPNVQIKMYGIISNCTHDKRDAGAVAETDIACVCGASRLFVFGFWHWTFPSLVGNWVERLRRQCGCLLSRTVVHRRALPPTRADDCRYLIPSWTSCRPLLEPHTFLCSRYFIWYIFIPRSLIFIQTSFWLWNH